MIGEAAHRSLGGREHRPPRQSGPLHLQWRRVGPRQPAHRDSPPPSQLERWTTRLPTGNTFRVFGSGAAGAARSILATVHSKLSVWTAQKRTRLVAEDSASARTSVLRFMRACVIAAPPPARFSSLLTFLWCLLLQAAAVTAEPVTAYLQVRPTPTPPARLQHQANPPRAPASARVLPQPLCPLDQRTPPPASPHHHPPLFLIAHPVPSLFASLRP